MFSVARAPSAALQRRLFLTCWLIFAIHFATDVVREYYLAFSLAEDYSFRVDKYLGLHVDLFDLPGHGAHIDNNPGASMLGAIPYWLCRPIIAPIVRAVNAERARSGAPLTAIYNDPTSRKVQFYKDVRQRGLDVQFGLATAAIHVLLMAPLSALAAVLILRVLAHLGLTMGDTLLGALLFAFGTPVFFRTAFLNQNLMIAHAALAGFVALWRPGGWPAWTDRRAAIAAGAVGGFAVLCDYSGAVVFGWLALYAVWRSWARRGSRGAVESGSWYTAAAAPSILLLLFYQWQSFGSPWYPGQHYMPKVELSVVGYRGVAVPQWDIAWMLLFDYHFGLFVACPMLALALWGTVRTLRGRSWLPRREAAFLGVLAALVLTFFSAVAYSRIQWHHGIRYLLPLVPGMFLLSFVALLRLPRQLRYSVIVLTFAWSWCQSMVRSQSIPDSVAQVFLGGFQLPWMNVLSRMATQYYPFMEHRTSPLPLFVLCGALIAGLWWRYRREPLT